MDNFPVMSSELLSYFAHKWPVFPKNEIQLLGDPTSTWYLPPSWVPILPEQFIGVEIEVERVGDLHSVYDYIPAAWIGMVEDGSLRNNGREFVTCPHPTKYTEALLGNLFKRLPPKADFSLRTSVHVHFNVRDMTYGQVLTVLYTYLVLERLLYQWVGHNREKSIFCVPIQDTLLPANFLSWLEGIPSQINWMKYTGMNLLPIREKGTIEFRHLNGTGDLTRILSWINLISGIFKFAKETPYPLAHERIVQLNSSSEYMTFLLEVSPELLTYANKEIRDYRNLMEKGVSYIKETVFPNKFWDQLVRESTNSCEAYKRTHRRTPATLKNISSLSPEIVSEWAPLFTANTISVGGGGGTM